MNSMTYLSCCVTLAMFGLFVQAVHSRLPAHKQPAGNDDLFKRIVGGIASAPNKWPWQALLLQQKDDDSSTYKQICAAVLIDPQWVVTSAACVYSVEKSVLKVVLGENNRDEVEGNEQEFQVSLIHRNSRLFADVEYGYNIALLKLSSPAVNSNAVQPVALPKLYEQVPVGTKCYMLGWGAREFGGEKSNVLQEVQIPVVSYEECRLRNEKLLYSKVDKYSMLCAGYSDNKTLVTGCRGDAGGSFVCKEGSKWVLQGMISWGDGKCGGYYYSIMTRMSSFIQWIDYMKTAPPLEKPTTCTDAHYYCQEWKAKGFCDIGYYAHMLKGYYCKKTCGAC